MRHVYHDDAPLQGAPYTAKFADGSTRQGTTDGNGNVHISDVPPGTAQIQFKPDSRPYEVKTKADNPDYKPVLSDADIDGLIKKYRSHA